MDRILQLHQTELDIHKRSGDTTKYWKVWSKAVERGFLHYLDVSKVFDRKCKGRGELILVNVKNQADKKKRGETEREALRATRRRRRSSRPGDASS